MRVLGNSGKSQVHLAPALDLSRYRPGKIIGVEIPINLPAHVCRQARHSLVFQQKAATAERVHISKLQRNVWVEIAAVDFFKTAMPNRALAM